MNNKICWFEIYVKDMDRAKKFYASVLGYPLTDMNVPGDDKDMKMATFSSAAESSDEMSVSGALVYMPGTKGSEGESLHTMVYFPCEDCAVEESRVVAAGGIVQNKKISLGDHGFCSVCIDTEGNTFGLYSMQ